MSTVSKMVEFGKNGDKVPAYMAHPDDDGQHPGVIVIQEWWGLNEHIKDLARRMADAGYVAIAPDLYRGVVAAEPDEARKLMMDLERDDALADISAGVQYLLEQDSVVPKSIGIMGFCMGGSLSAWMSTKGDGVGACVIFYGGFRDDVEVAVQQVQVPFLGLFGEADMGVPVAGVRQLESLLEQHGKTHDINIYPDAPHAFFNDTRQSYREEFANDAWAKTLAWFDKHLK
jgi:carboxymethylenebutenolidase